MQHTTRHHRRAAPWALGISLLPSASGGGDDDSNSATEPPATAVGSATGVLTDAAVQGVAGSASPSGATSTTPILAENRPGGLAGVWAVESATVLKTQTLMFCKDGRSAMVDPVGDDSPRACGGPGVAFGTHRYDATTLAFQVLTVSDGTNGCAGLSDVGGAGLAVFQISIDASGNVASEEAGDDRSTLHCISR